MHFRLQRLAKDFQKNRPEGIDIAPVHLAEFLNQDRLHVGTSLLPDVQIVLRKSLGCSEQMLPLLIALRVREKLADGVKRQLDIDVTEIRQDIGSNIDDPFNRDARIAAEGRFK